MKKKVLALLIFASVFLCPLSSRAGDITYGYSVDLTLKEATYHAGDTIEGEVVLTSRRTGYPVTIPVRLYRDDELRYTKMVHFPQLYMGHESYPLKTFGITTLSEPGHWRIEIGPPDHIQAQAEVEIADDSARSDG